jgi:hypothetical protein
MKLFRILSLLLVAGLMFSCEKEIEDSVKTQDVGFGIKDVNPLLKSGWDWVCSDDLAVSALIKIDDKWYNPYVFYLNGNLYTQSVKLPVKNGYQLKEFLLLNVKLTQAEIDGYSLLPARAKILKAAPLAGSEYGYYVQNPLVVPFDVEEFTKTEKDVEVLCYQPGDHEMFGFKWFNIEELVVREICFFGDLCLKNTFDYQNTDYGTVFNLANYPFDLPAIFKISAYKNNEATSYATFTNIHLINGNLTFTGPVCAKFPDPVKANQSIPIKFVMEVLVKVGNQQQYVTYKTWEFDSKNPIVPIAATNQKVVDFVIGNCYSPENPPMHIFPPYQNLPATAKVNLSTDSPIYASGAYWKLVVKELNGSTSAAGFDFPSPSNKVYLGWCGDASESIPTGDNVFNIYSSLGNIPAGLSVTKESIAKVNWLFNNLKQFGYPELTKMFIEQADFSTVGATKGKDLQHAIWRLLGQTPANNAIGADGFNTPSAKTMEMFNAANGMANFVPLPGGYAAVLMQKSTDTKAYQLVFTIVDP